LNLTTKPITPSEEIGEIADSSTTPRIFLKEERLPSGVLNLTAEVPIACLIVVGRPFIDL